MWHETSSTISEVWEKDGAHHSWRCDRTVPTSLKRDCCWVAFWGTQMIAKLVVHSGYSLSHLMLPCCRNSGLVTQKKVTTLLSLNWTNFSFQRSIEWSGFFLHIRSILSGLVVMFYLHIIKTMLYNLVCMCLFDIHTKVKKSVECLSSKIIHKIPIYYFAPESSKPLYRQWPFSLMHIFSRLVYLVAGEKKHLFSTTIDACLILASHRSTTANFS